MNEPSPRASARILQFRLRPAAGGPARARVAEITRLREPAPAIVDTGAWYHAEAIDQQRKR